MTDPAAPPPQDAPRSRRGWFRNGCLTLVVLFGVLAIIGTLTGGNDRTPVERAEQDEGVEGGGKEPEAKKPLQGEKAVEPESGEREQSRSLYQQAVLEETPPYEIDFTASDTGQ